MVKCAALWLLVIISCGLKAQSTAILDANNVKATIGADGTLFKGGLEVPKGSGHTSLGVSQLWIGGKNNGNLHIAARLHDSDKLTDFWPGPIDTANQTAGDSMFWNKIYTVNKADIIAHIENWNKTGYTIPDNIKNWPGSNPTTQAFKQVLATFVDYNANRKYEPEMGEYPIIKGDQATYFIINDIANTHFATGGLPMGIEIHGLAYVFANKPELENTVFMEISFINRSANNYDSVFAGVWTDFALGKPGDEYISTYPTKNAFLVYDNDSVDADYGSYPPAQAVIFLNRPLQYTIEVEVDNTVANRGIPQNANEFYNFLNRKWRNGLQLTEGSNGYMSSTTKADFIYNGNPCDGANPGWTEIGSAQAEGRRTMVGSFGPVSLAAGAYQKLELAYVWERGMNSTVESICKLNTTVDIIKAFYNKEISGVQQPIGPKFTVYPNPANQTAFISFDEALYSSLLVELYDLQGRNVLTETVANSGSTVAIQHLSAGFYTLKVSADGQSTIQKLMITR